MVLEIPILQVPASCFSEPRVSLDSCHFTYFSSIFIAMERKGEKNVWRGKWLGRSASFFVALLLYNFLFERVGYLLTTFFFLTFLFWVTMGEGKGKKAEWVLILGGAALTSFLSYLIFSRLFMLMFPRGLIKFI